MFFLNEHKRQVSPVLIHAQTNGPKIEPMESP